MSSTPRARRRDRRGAIRADRGGGAGPAHVSCRGARCARPRAAARRSLTTSTIIAAPHTTSWCSPTISRPAEKRAVVHARIRRRGDAARAALRVRALRAGALRRHGLGKRSHRASHVRLRAQHAGRAAANACAAAASTCGPSASSIRSSIAGTRRVTTSSTRTRKAKASTCTASAARAARAAPASGMAAKLWTSDNFTNAQVSSNGPRHAAFKLKYAPWDAGAAGEGQRDQAVHASTAAAISTPVESVFDFVVNDAVVGIGITRASRRRRAFPRPCSRAIRKAAG